MTLRLHYAPDNASAIIRFALEELGLPYETTLVDRAARAQDSAAYRRLNPRGLIPVLETPEGPIFETAAILLWLVEQTGRLGPAPGARGAFLSWLFAVSNGLHADLRALFYAERYAGPDPEDQRAFRARAEVRVAEFLRLLEGLDAPFFAQAEPSVLDLYLALLLRWCALYPVGGTAWFRLEATPRLAALCRRLEQRPSARRLARAEGLGATPFSAPLYATPPEGSAT